MDDKFRRDGSSFSKVELLIESCKKGKSIHMNISILRKVDFFGYIAFWFSLGGIFMLRTLL